MKRGTRIQCIKDVVMVNGVKAFSEGNFYRTYPYTYKEGWDTVVTVTCAKNDQKERHILIKSDDETFFKTHFRIA